MISLAISRSITPPRLAPRYALIRPQKVRDRQLAAPAESETLQALVLNELKSGKHVATEGLVWLIRYDAPPCDTSRLATILARHLVYIFQFADNIDTHSGLDFTAQALRHNLDNGDVELSNSFRDAYGNTLKPHHSFVIKPIFSAAMSATPYRKDFYAKLGDDNAKIRDAMEREVKALEERVAILKAFLGRKEAQW